MPAWPKTASSMTGSKATERPSLRKEQKNEKEKFKNPCENSYQ